MWGEDGMETDDNNQYDSSHKNEPHLPTKKGLMVEISN